MRNVTMVLSCLILFLVSDLFSQVRYKDEIFSSYKLVSNITYGTGTKNLLDIYTGTGDVATNRPLIIFMHGGAFKNGSKESGSAGAGYVKYFCYGMAKRGYVVASINYRLAGWSDDATHFKAMIEALQDCKAAVRFFRKNASTYGIDTSHIYVSGESAGAHAALHMGLLVDSTKVPSYFSWSSVGGTFEGTSGNPGYSSQVHGVISNWGALVDTNYMTASSVPVFCAHGLKDVTVPPSYGTSDSPFDYGSQLIYKRAQNLGVISGVALYPNDAHSLSSNATDLTDDYVKSAAWLYTVLTKISVPLTLSSPYGGELIQAGSAYDIKWIANGVTNVNIDYSTNSGTSWSSIAINVAAAAGSYSWTVPSTVATTCRVRVTNSADGSQTAMSQSDFSILTVLPASITITSPVGAETFPGGKVQNITWNSTNIAGVKIEYSSDNGTSWSIVAPVVSASAGTYAWTVPNVATAQGLIKLSDTANVAPSSMNIDVFSVTFSVLGLLYEENFDYPVGDSLNGIHGGWVSHSGTGQFPPRVVSPGLSYAGYTNSGIGNAVRLNSAGEDINKKVTIAADSIISGSAYVSFLVRVDTAKSGDIFLHLGQYSFTSTSAQRCRVYAKAASTGSSNIAFGLFKGSSTTVTNPVYTDTIYKVGTTYLIVVKYVIVPGSSNDYCQMWVNPALNGSEPTSMLTDSSYTVSDLNSVGCVALRQGTLASSPSVVVDGIRLATAWSALGSVTAVKESSSMQKLAGFQLNQNYPNPFNPDTRISYSLSQTANTQVVVYDVLGRIIQTIKNETQTAGYHEVVWNARSSNGSVMPSGIYFCRVQSGNDSKVIKMILNR